MPATPVPAIRMTFEQALAHLDSDTLKQASLANAVVTGLHLLNRHQKRGYDTMLRALFLSVSPTQVVFQLHEDERRMSRMRYCFDPETSAQPQLLEEINGAAQPSALTALLQRVFDVVLAQLEGQVWKRVAFDRPPAASRASQDS